MSEDTRQQAEIERWDCCMAYEVDLFVMNPSGTFFNRCWQDETNRRGGTWHFPCGNA